MHGTYLKKWSLPPEVVKAECNVGKLADIDAFNVENAFTRVQKHSSKKILETINLFREKEGSQELEHIMFVLPNTEIEVSGGLLSENLNFADINAFHII